MTNVLHCDTAYAAREEDGWKRWIDKVERKAGFTDISDDLLDILIDGYEARWTPRRAAQVALAHLGVEA